MYQLKATEISKRFEARKVFSKISFELETGQSIAVVGPNGSGKSTMLKVLLSLLRPSRGKIEYTHDGTAMSDGQTAKHSPEPMIAWFSFSPSIA